MSSFSFLAKYGHFSVNVLARAHFFFDRFTLGRKIYKDFLSILNFKKKTDDLVHNLLLPHF